MTDANRPASGEALHGSRKVTRRDSVTLAAGAEPIHAVPANVIVV